MKTKHTQSEWILNTQIDMELYKVVDLLVFTYENNDKSKPFAICRIHGESTEEGQANAKIIAAAPDMLEALIQVRNYFGENDKTTSEHYMFSIADKAIKKATE